MKKLSLFLGTLGGALAGYVFSNTKLREELTGAKDAEEAGRILAKHLSTDSKQIGKEVKQFVESDVVQDNVKKAKKYADAQVKKLKGDLQNMMGTKKKPATHKPAAHKPAKKTAAKKKVQPSKGTKKAK